MNGGDGPFVTDHATMGQRKRSGFVTIQSHSTMAHTALGNGKEREPATHIHANVRYIVCSVKLLFVCL